MWRIAVVFILFMGFVISIVVYTAFLDVDLVAEDYYQQEVDYQDIIDAKANSVEIKAALTLQQTTAEIIVTFPSNMDATDMDGNIRFYHPKSAKFDVELPLKLSDDHKQVIDKAKFIKGNYTVKIQWKQAGKLYYIEKSLFVS